MVGCSALLAVDQRLRQARPDMSSVLFRGFSIILFGDLGQLPPVGDSPLFMARAGLRSVQGHACYLSFAQAFILSASVRQSADDAFRDLLVRLWNGESSQDDYQLLCGRCVARVDQGDFAHAVRLFPARVLLTVASVRFRTSSICRTSRHQLCRISSCAHFRSILGRLSFQHCHTPCRLFLLRVSGIPATALSHGHNFRCVSHTQFDRISRLGVAPSVLARKLEEIRLRSLAPRVTP